MAFKGPVKKGEVRNPKGHPGFTGKTHNKPWRDAVNKALLQYENKSDDPRAYVKRGEALFKIATQMVECALDKDDDNFQFAVKEIGMRQDGKPV